MLNRLLHWRSLFVVLALAIVSGTVWYTRYVAGKIIREERQRVEEWVQANRLMQRSDNPEAISLANLVIVNNEDMPLIATDEQNRVVDHRNLDSAALAADSTYLYRQLARLKAENPPIDWVISDSPRLLYKVYYGNTRLLTEVQYYPLVQLLVVAIFVALLLALLRTQSRSTQNQLWAGLAKETAHQMGTPITSLRGWVEMLREQQVNPELVAELEKDVDRLKLVSDRFAKIGSAPQLEPTDLSALVSDMVDYMRRRAPGSIHFVWQPPAGRWQVRLSATLINWVLENLLKNALDAMDGAGSITLQLNSNGQHVWLDVTDTGKGIAPAHLGRVFAPGFTTKKRGWGLGLTLSKRIVEQYHGGQLFVKHSEPGVGTTFRMLLPRGLPIMS
jgi:signal transduction histidine kinase